MFEAAELDHRIDKATYDAQAPQAREALLMSQLDMVAQAKFPLVIIMAGLDGGGRSDTINLLNAWMDARHITTFGEARPSEEELDHPWLWRFWRVLPPKGHTGIFYSSWYGQPLRARMLGKIGKGRLSRYLDEIQQFEQMLTAEGALVVKFWFHMRKEQQKQRFKLLSRDPLTRWRVTKTDWARFRQYAQFRRVAEQVLRRTDSANAPWFVIAGQEARYRHLRVVQILTDVLQKRLQAPATPLIPLALPVTTTANTLENLNVLRALNLQQTVRKSDYLRELAQWQGKLNHLTRTTAFANTGLVLVFEGNDAAGKGGSIRRLTAALDARCYQVVPIAAPSDEEKAQPYLWRFWRHIPKRGRVVIFDRSWYGRVLVERIEGFCQEHDWQRAYSEINAFEGQLHQHGLVICKFWLAISAEEQLQRFQAREEIGFKRFKITQEDWRNRDKWNAYEPAVCDMVERTSTPNAPWTLVEADNKYFARLKILRTVCVALEQQLTKISKKQRKNLKK